MSTRWGSFNIGANESVQAHQPGASSRLLIRVDGGGATNIAGSYTSNGITILENRNGVQFSRGAIVNVGGLLATSSRISGVRGNNWQLNGTGGAVVNHGTITAGAGGAILAAVKVQNTGDITAQGGDVALGAGSSFTVDFAGSMVGFEITKAASGASITNSGKIEAQGGVVALSAQEAQEVRTNVVSVGGVVKATRIERRGGVVYLSGGDEGVAEVSGDVQASEQIQTTGEYVVVKEGAVLAAPDILVGGDFQGRGDVQTAQRTLVERGALLDAGAEGRVIVWSDDVTWFNGNINVPGGFAEVSGKGNLAAVNLPGINVGAGGTLLLDPLRIIIDATSTTNLGAGVLFADNADGDTNINAADIASFTGALELQARGGIRVTADIISTSLTSLTLRAQDDFGPDGVAGGGDDGPDFTGNGDANNIGFFGTTTLDLGEASLTLIAGVVNIRNDATSTITARGGLTFRFTRDGLNLATAQATHVTGFTAGANTTLTYAFGLDGVADNISETAINCAGQTSVCSITRATDENVQISSGNLSASESLTIDINLGILSFAGTGLITVSAPTVSITAGSLDIGTRNLIIEATGGSLTLNTPIINGATGVGASRVLRAVNGSITIGDNIAGAGTGNNANIDSDLTISSTGTGAGIVLDGDIDLRGRAVELTGAIAGTAETPRRLTIKTIGMGDITLNSNINLQGGTLDLRTDRLGGRIITTGSPVIMVGVLSLLEGTNTGTDTGYTANLFSTMSRATTEAIIRVAMNATAAVIHPWMAGLNSASFRLQAVGGVVPMVTLPASFVSTGNIELRAGAIALSGEATTTLSGAAVTLTGGITGAGGLDLTATDRLTLNSGIAIGGALAIIAGERINLATPNTVITAGGAFTINFTDPAVADNEAGFTLDDGTATLGNLDATNSSPPTITFIPDIPDNDCVINGEACSLIRDDANLETADASLESDVGITISIGTGTLTFGGGLVEITIDAPTVSITAGNIDIGTRALTITASGGALTLNTPITADAGSMGNVEIFATGGALTIGGDINTRGGALDLSSMGAGAGITLNGPITLDGAAITLTGAITETGTDALTVRATGALTLNSDIDIDTGALTLTSATGNIVTPGTPTLTASMVSLTQASAFTALAPFTFATPTLNLTATTSQPFYGWMVDRAFVRSAGITGRNLTLTGASITFTGNVNAGGGNLTLVATGSGFTLDDNRRLEGAAITLTGFFSGDGNNFTITATDDITLNSNIEMDGGSLTLTADGSNIVLGNDITLDGGAIMLTGAIDASDTGNGGNHALTVMAGGVLTLNSDIDTGAGTLTLSGGTGIVLGSALISLTGGFVTLTGAIDESANGDSLTIEASGTGRTSNLVIGGNINLGAGVLTLTSRGGGNIFHDGTLRTLTASTVSLTQDIAFFLLVPFTFATPTLNLEAGAAQTLHRWIANAATDRTLNLTAAGDITLTTDVNVGGGNLTLVATGSNNIVLQDNNIEITGAAITLTGAIDASDDGFAFTITATGDITLNSNIDLFDGDLTLTATGSNIVLGAGNITLTGGNVALTGAIDGNNPLTVMADSVLTLNSDINTGTGALSLSGTSGITLGPLTDNLTGMAISLTGAISRPSGDPRGLTIRATGGVLTLNDNIDIGISANLILGSAIRIELGAGDISLAGRAVTLTGAITRPSGTANLTVTAENVLTLNSNINTGGGNLILNSPSSRIVIPSTGTIELDGAAITLNGQINGDGAALDVDATGVLMLGGLGGDNISIGAGNLSLTGGTIVLGGILNSLEGGAITLTGAITRPSGTANLAITATTGALTLNDNIDIGGGNLSLEGTSIALVGPITLDGEAITLTGALTSSNNLTINAGGRLTLNSAINLGGGTLAITADERIAVPNAMTLITAGAFTIVFTDPVVQDTATGFVGAFTNLTGDTAGLTFAPPLAADCTGQIGNCSLGVDGTDLLVVATLTLAALETLTIDIGTTAMLTFDGIGAIMITARAVTITAGTIDIGGRNLSIRTTNGKLTLNTSIINAGTLILSSATSSDPAIVLSRNTMLSGVNIDITGSISVQRNLTVMATDTLTLNSNISVLGNNTLSLTGGTGGITLGNPIELVGTLINLTGVIDGNNGLTIRTNTFANVVLTLNDNINTGTGNLTLISDPGPLVSEFGSIVLGSGLTFLRGNAVSLTGVVTRASGDANLGIMATGALTLNNNITISALGTLTLMTGAGAIGGDATELTAGTVSLNQVAAFDPTAPFIFGAATSLTLTTATAQTVHGWMTSGDRALSLTTTGAITVNDNIDTGTRALTLSAGTSIFLRGVGGARTLEGSAVTLTGILDSRVSGDGAAANNIIITADNGDITITGNIIASGNDGVGFGNPGGAGGALTLTANSGNITITGNFTATGGVGGFVPSVGGVSGAGGAGGAVTLMAGNIMIGNINAGGGGVAPQRSQDANGGNGGSGGAVMITGTGTVQIGEIRANGVNGQGTTNDNNGGTGGAGGGITLGGASVSVRLINSVRGRGGVNQGEGSNGSGGVAGSVMITASGGDLTLMGSINVSGGALTLRAPGNNVRVIGSVPTLTASTVTINQGDEFANNLIIAEATSLILTTTRAQIVRPWMTAGSNRSLSLTSSGAIIINADITLGSGNLTLIGMGGITVNGSRTLSGGAITLEGVIDSGSSELTVTASGQLTLNSNITTRILTLTAGTSGTGDIATGASMPTLIANLVRLTQAGAFAEDALFTFGGRMTPSLVLRVTGSGMDQAVYDWMIRTEGDPDNSRGLNLRTTGAITIDRNIDTGSRDLILFGTALTFTGDMARTLSGANVTLTGNATNAGALTIRAGSTLTLNSNITTTGGGNISITGGTGGITTSATGVTLTSDGTITTSGDITADTGNGDLTLNALSMTAGTITLGGSINLGTGTATLTAAAGSADTGPLRGTSVITAAEIEIIFTSTQVTGPGNVPAIGTTITFAGDTSPMIMYGARECNVGNDCVISFEGALVVQHQLTAVDSITIEAIADGDGVSSVRFGGERATITLTAPLVTIIADMINLEGRNLVIVDTNGGTLALAGNVSGAAAITVGNLDGTTFGFINIVGARTIAGDAITLTATLIRTVNRAGTTNTPAAHNLTITATGGLTIATGINISAGDLTLTAGAAVGTSDGDIIGTSTPMLTAGTVSLTQDGTFGGTALFTFAASVGALNLTTGASAPQTVHPWMFAMSGRALSLTSTGGRLLIRGNINIGAGDLFLSGMGIELDRSGAITLTGGAISLTGNVDGSLNAVSFTIVAGGILMLNGNINNTLGDNSRGGDIMLTGSSIVLRAGGSGISLSGDNVELTGAISSNVSTASLTITALGDITINDNIRFDTSDSTLTLRAGTDGSGNITSSGTPTLTVRTVSLTQAGTFAADLFTLAAGVTSLTLNAGSAAQTVHAWIAGGTNRALSLTTTGAITIGRDIATGTSNLTLVGGSLTLTAAAALSGADIALTGAATGTANLTITASGTLTLNSNITLTGSGLTLTLSGAGAIGNGGSSTALAASTVSLAQVAEFDGTALFTFTADTLNLTTAAAQTVYGWMTSGNRSLNLTSTGREITTGSINTGTGDLTLSALAIELMGSPSFIGRNVVLDGPVDGRSGGSGSFTVMATGNITINGNVNVGAGTATSITLTADSDGNGTGNILSDVDTGETLTAGTVSLTQAGAFAPDALFTFDPLAVGTLNLTTAAPQTVHNAWMVATGRTLSLTTTGAITIADNIVLGAGDLTLSGSMLTFTGTAARTLSGGNISLTGAATSGGALTITTADTLTITSNITVDGNLMLTGGTGGIVIGTATGAGAFALSGDAITLAGDVTTASNAANSTDFTITAQGTLTVAGIDLSNSDDSAYGDLLLIAGAGTQDADLVFSAGVGTTLNAASVELRQDTDFTSTRPATILIEGDDLGDTNPEMITISGEVQVPWAAILVTVGDLTITDDGGDDDPDDIAGNTGIVLATARLSYTGNITLNAGAGDITFETGLGNITWEAANITITAGSIVLGARTLTITAGEDGTLTLNVTSIIATGTNDLAFAGTTIRLGRTAPGSATGTTTLTGAAITLTAANGITVGRFSNSGAFISTGAPILVVNASGAVTIAADITSVARINLGSADNAVGIAVTGARTLSGSLIRFNSDVTANDGLTVNSTAGNLIFNGNITTGTSALSLTSAAAIRILGEANATRTLTGGDITLTAANGVEVGTSTLSLTVTASGVLTIAAAITTEGTLTLQGAGAIVGTAGRPRLTASTVSLTQIDVFAEVGQFRFTADSLVLTNTAAAGALQDVHNWMIGLNRNLTLTSPARVRVAIAIGASVLSRNLGDGSITLMSTGADIRIRENISTTGNIILSGSVGINFNGRAAKTLSGADITLTGAVVSNRDLTLTASGTLTLNSDITATASNLVLTGGGGITLGSALTLSGGDVTLTGMISEAANGLTITAVGTLTINSDGIATGSGDLSLTGAAIRLGRTAPGSDTGTATLTGAAITLTAANGITVGRFNNSGAFISTGAPALMVTASGVLTIAANIRSVADITLEGTGGIVIGTATVSSALLWRGSDITLTGAVTTASTAGIDNFTSLTVRASGNLVVGAIDLGNDAGGSADDWGDLRLRADTGTITVTGVSTIIDAGSILFQQDAELFDATEPANLHINGEDVSGTPSLRSMVLVFYSGPDNQDSVTWGTVIEAGAIVHGTSDDPFMTPIMLNNGVLLSLVSITINAGTGEVTFAGMGDITLAAPVITITAGSINTNDRNLTITTDGGTLTLISNIALTGTGNLTLTSGTIQITRGPDDVAGTVRTLSGANITLTAADGILLGRLNRGGTFLTRDAVANLTVMASGVLTIAADITVDSTATSGGNIALTGGSIAFGTAARTISGVDIMLMGNAAGSADLTITASGTLTLNSNINTGAGALTLSGAGAIVGAGTPELTASTVSLRQAAAFAEDVLFTFGSATDSLEFTTTVNQDVHDWMINDGIDLTVESPGRVRVEVAIGAGSGRDLGAGALTLTSTGGAVRIVANITTTGNITLSGATGINLNSTSTSTGMVTLTGAAITLSGNALSNRALTITATDALRVENNITLTGMSNLTLMSATVVRIFADISTDGDITLSGGGTIGINLNSGAGAKTFSGAAITLTGAAVSNRDLTLDASGTLTLSGEINTGTSALSLSGSSVALGGALTLTGGDITLTGAATGGANLTITASGTLTINNDINTGAGALTLRGAGAIVGPGRPRLTAGTVSFAQDAAFGARPFGFTAGSLALTTEAAQDVLDWMIVADRNLTVTSAANVFVRSAIGSSVDGRDLGGGSITLTSTGGAIRILAGISTTGDLTLDASTLVNLNSGAGAKTLSGAAIMLSGDALSNRDLTLTASGALTLNGDITATASNLVLTGGTGGIDLSGGARTISGVDITLTGVAASDANVTINASGILTINSDITLTGTGLTLALRGAGAIGDGDSATALTASTVRLRQVAAFADDAQFTFGSATGSLLLITDTNQDVHDWMINDGINLTVRSSARVRVIGAAIGSGNRVLGAGSLTLRSTGAAIRILANITTGGAITLDGATGINTRGGARTFSGEGITLNGAVTSIGDDVIINANSGILSLSSDVDTRDVTDPAASPTFGNLTLTGETIEIGRRATDTPTDTRILLRGGNITLTSASGIQIGRITRDGFFLTNDSVANFIVTADGTLTIAANITVASTATLGGDIALTSRSTTTPIAFTGARTITGRDITLTGAATGTANLTIAATGILTFIGDSIATGSGNLSLTGATINLGRTTPGGTLGTVNLTGSAITLTSENGITVGRFSDNGDFRPARAPALVVDASGVLTIAAAITSVAGLTLEGADAIVTTPDRPRLTASTVSLTQIDAFAADERGRGLFRFAAGSLVLSTAAAQDVHNWMISPDRNLTLTSALQVRVEAAIGADLEGRDLGDGSITLTSTGGAIRILADISTTGDLTLDASTLINLNGRAAKTLSGANVTLTGAVLSDRDLTLTATGALTLNSNIALTGDGLTLALRGAGAIGDGGTDTALTASTVRLRQVAAFAEDAQFTFGSATGSLLLITDTNQDVHDWMINDGINLTVRSSARVRVMGAAIGSGNRNLGAGSLTLRSTGGIVRILADISTGGAITLDGATGIDIIGGARTLSGEGITLNGAVTSTGDDVSIDANGGILSLNGNVDTRDVTDPASPAFGDLTLEGATIQIGRAASTPANTRILLRGQNIMLTAANGIQIGRFNRGGGFRSNSDAANLTVRAIGALTIAGSITVDSAATSGGDIALTGNSIAFTGARTITGRAITLTGAATGTANLTITASGTLTINSDITLTGSGLTLALSGAGVIGNGGRVGADRPELTATTVSFTQDAAFDATRLFRFGAGSSLVFITDAAQDVHNWMIFLNSDLTVTSAANVFVRSAIGGSLTGRDLGTGSLTLTSTGGAIRILADISTTGDLTLDASTLINLNGGVVGVRTLAGAIVTLTGNAQSNRDLTLTATTFALGDDMSTINVGANMLTITAGSNLPASLTGDDRLTAGTLDLSFSCPIATCVDTTP